MMRKAKRVWMVCALALAGCAGEVALEEEEEEEASLAGAQLIGPAAQRQWDDYVREVRATPLQPACTPREVVPPNGVPYRGVAILYHGFTACPQQFHELANLVAARGFVVLLPLLPGHGGVPARSGNGVVDPYDRLPNEDARGHYRALGERMNAIARAAPGKRVTGGLSVGGAVAAAALEAAPGVYLRGFLLAPFFQLAIPNRWLIPALNAVRPEHPLGWGPACEVERGGARGGYCQFLVTHLRAVQRFGGETLAGIDRVTAPLHIVAVEGDTASSTGAITSAASARASDTTCFMPKGVPHSFLSRFDSPGEDKYWLGRTLSALTSLVEIGRAFPTDGQSGVAPYPRCATR